jgi:hypothetical protein
MKRCIGQWQAQAFSAQFQADRTASGSCPLQVITATVFRPSKKQRLQLGRPLGARRQSQELRDRKSVATSGTPVHLLLPAFDLCTEPCTFDADAGSSVPDGDGDICHGILHKGLGSSGFSRQATVLMLGWV